MALISGKSAASGDVKVGRTSNKSDRRSEDAKKYRRWYNLSIWKDRLRPHQLAKQPLCERCLARGLVTVATVVHHKDPHKGDWQKFIAGPFESACKPCHDSDAQSEELTGYSKAIGIDGFPIDPRHPANG